MPLKPVLPPLIAALSPSQRLANQRTGTEFGEPRSLLRQHKAESAWVLLFNAGERNEGVYAHAHACRMPTRVLSKPAHSAHWLGLGRYTLQGRQAPEMGRGTYVLAFEQYEEASRFAMLLQAQGFDMPTATEWPAEQLSEFCSSTEFGLGFVPHEALLVPPQVNYFDETAFEVVAKLQEVEEAYGADGAEVRLARARALLGRASCIDR